MTFFVRFWGTRGSIPTPANTVKKYGGNTSCVEIRTDDALFICDGGTGLREFGVELIARNQGKPIVGHMLFSHTHWDHIQGFPFFTPVYDAKNTFYVYGNSPGDRRVHQLLSGQMSSDYFPVDFKDLKGHIVASDLGDGTRTVEGVQVTCFEQRHPGRSFAYAFQKGTEKVVFATDNEIDLLLPDPTLPTRDPSIIRPIPKAFVDFCRGADLLICDGQYFDEEYDKKVGWGHPRATTCVDLALLAGAKQLAIFHHDPMHTDADVDRKIAVCKERAAKHDDKLVVFGAREGLELRVGS